MGYMSEENKIKFNIPVFEKDLEDLKKKYNLDPVATIEFPQYRILPEEVLLALKILERYQYKIMLTYKHMEEKDGN